jgi:hypothetical protein
MGSKVNDHVSLQWLWGSWDSNWWPLGSKFRAWPIKLYPSGFLLLKYYFLYWHPSFQPSSQTYFFIWYNFVVFLYEKLRNKIIRWQEKKLKEYLCYSVVFTLDSSLSSSPMVFHVCLCCSCFNFHVCLSSSLTFMSVSLCLSFYPHLCFFLTKQP